MSGSGPSDGIGSEPSIADIVVLSTARPKAYSQATTAGILDAIEGYRRRTGNSRGLRNLEAIAGAATAAAAATRNDPGGHTTAGSAGRARRDIPKPARGATSRLAVQYHLPNHRGLGALEIFEGIDHHRLGGKRVHQGGSE